MPSPYPVLQESSSVIMLRIVGNAGKLGISPIASNRFEVATVHCRHGDSKVYRYPFQSMTRLTIVW